MKRTDYAHTNIFSTEFPSDDLPPLDFNRETLDKDLIEATRQRIRAIQVGQFGTVDASGLSVVIVK